MGVGRSSKSGNRVGCLRTVYGKTQLCRCSRASCQYRLWRPDAMTDATTVQPLYDTYNRAALRFERGEGIWLITESGERYLDFAAGIAVNSLGHSHPHQVETLKTQADKIWHLSNVYEIPAQEKLGRRLVENTFADKVFFTN